MIPTSAYNLLLRDRARAKCSFGCQFMDAAFGGGVPGHGVTEISGAAGVGKTQLCMQLSFQCQLAESDGGLGGSVAYLCCGEGEFPITRFAEILRLRSGMYPSAAAVQFLEGLHIEKYHTVEDLLDSLKKKIPMLCDKLNLKLLVLDSIAGLVRSEYDTRDINEIKQRTKMLFAISSTLKWLSDTFSIAVVVTNQVADKVANGIELRSQTTSALGLVWAHCVNTRFVLQRKRRNDYFESKEDADAIVDSCNDDTSGTEETRVVRDIKNLSEIPRSDRDRQLSNNRKIILETSPSMCYKSCSYEILSSGIRAAPGSEWSHASLKESFL